LRPARLLRTLRLLEQEIHRLSQLIHLASQTRHRPRESGNLSLRLREIRRHRWTLRPTTTLNSSLIRRVVPRRAPAIRRFTKKLHEILPVTLLLQFRENLVGKPFTLPSLSGARPDPPNLDLRRSVGRAPVCR